MEKIKNKRADFTGILLLSGIAVLYFIYGPLELYANNVEDFAYDLGDLMSVLPIAAVAAVAVITAVLAGLKAVDRRAWQIAVAVLFVFFVASYVQGTFLPQNLPPMDGTPVSWEKYDYQRVFSAACILILAAVAVVAVRCAGFDKAISTVRIICAILSAVLLVSSVLLVFSEGVTQDKPKQYASEDELLNMSDDGNLVVVLADAVDADAFRQVYECHPEYDDLFEDFTFFPDTLAGYPYTSRAVPFILSGVWYENQGSFIEWCNTAFSSSDLVKVLKNDGYQLGFYCSEYNFAESLAETFGNIRAQQSEIEPISFLFTQLKMSAYRFFPYDLKKTVALTAEEAERSTAAEQNIDSYKCYPEELEETIRKNEVIRSDKKQFKFIYTFGAHLPFEYKAQSERIEDCTYLSSVEKTMSVCAEYISTLKESGMYDSTAIVILADHGYNGEESSGRQNPVLLVKGRDEKHEFRISEVSVSHADMKDAFLALESGADSLHAFPFAEGDSRERRFLHYEYAGEEYLTEYIQTGYAADESSMHETGERYVRRDFQWFVDGVNNRISEIDAD